FAFLMLTYPLLAIFFVFLCYSTAHGAEPTFAEASAIPSSHSKSRLIEMGKQILHTLAVDDLTAFFGFTPAIEIVQSNTVNAFAMAPGTLLLSTGLCQNFTSESEFAFVIAHEIGHLILHSEKYEDRHVESREFEADKFALQLLQKSGYNTQAGILLLTRLRNSPEAYDNGLLEARLALMQSEPMLELGQSRMS
ncbi:MAG: M48 family metalloprotease, partial [Bdellovibrionales bacterium]|nr:M48 family metalloprotease [Bdellovibrionales bacterium]